VMLVVVRVMCGLVILLTLIVKLVTSAFRVSALVLAFFVLLLLV
jgi:hypothetical protein